MKPSVGTSIRKLRCIRTAEIERLDANFAVSVAQLLIKSVPFDQRAGLLAVGDARVREALLGSFQD